MSIWQNTEVPEVKWETEDPIVFVRLSIQKLAPLMEEYPLIRKNEWDSGKYNWPKPDCWLWEWPKSPGWVPPSDTRCDLYEGENRSCIILCLPQIQPRISDEPRKGQGAQAVDHLYKKGQILGELLGEFVPLNNTFSDGWPMDFRRTDLGDKPIAPIYTKEKGNGVRKMNRLYD